MTLVQPTLKSMTNQEKLSDISVDKVEWQHRHNEINQISIVFLEQELFKHFPIVNVTRS